MTLFTEGRLQAFERMMQDTGYPRHRRTEDKDQKAEHRKPAAETKQHFWKEGGRHAGIPG